MLSVSMIIAIFVYMGWHKSARVKSVTNVGKSAYNNTIGRVTGELQMDEKSGVRELFEGAKKIVAPFISRVFNNLVDFCTKTIPKYILIAIIGIFFIKQTKLKNYIFDNV